jgi:HlyD family secretion protein
MPTALVAAGLLAATTLDDAARAQSAPPPAARDGVHALGRLEPETGLIAVGSRPGQRIDEIKVAIGDDVQAGQVLAILEGRAQAEAQLALAELRKRQAEFQRQAKIDGFALEREQFKQTSEPKTQAAATVADALRKLLDRATPLYKVGEAAATVAPGTLDKARLEDEGKYVELLAKTTQAELEKKLLDVEKDLNAKRAALEDAQVALDNPEFLMADAQVALAKANLEQTQVTAPRAGKILDVLAHAGEVGSGQLLLMGDVSKMVAVAEVFQSDVVRVRVGDAATVKILDESISGKVTRVGSVVGRNQAMNMDPRALKDVRVVKVWVALDGAMPAARLVDMEAEVVITPGGGG